MSYAVKWYSVERVLYLGLSDNLSMEEMKHVNEQVIDTLDKTGKNVVIMIDVSNLSSGYNTAEHLRNTQHYMHHAKVDAILVIANNKLNRLISLLAFNLARTPFFQFDTPEKAHQHLERRGFLVSSSNSH